MASCFLPSRLPVQLPDAGCCLASRPKDASTGFHLTLATPSTPCRLVSGVWVPLECHTHTPIPRKKPPLTRAQPRGNGPELSNFDENGVIRDMELYLNDLSLEYESVWDTKPSWCQPWTIILTGLVAVVGSWLVLQKVVVTALVASLVAAWWFLFLYSYPRAYTEMIAERRKKLKVGDEDTFGTQRIS